MSQLVCVVDGCDRGGQMRRGMCVAHYHRMRRRGTTDTAPIPAIEERLWPRALERPNGCLEWSGNTDSDGYGRINYKGRLDGTHRIAWELTNGPIPPGMCVCHRCDNPPCIQTKPTEGYPDGHLFLGTNDDNMADKKAKGRNRNGRNTLLADLGRTVAS